MPDGTKKTLFVDTSSLRRAGFNDPDLQKLLKFSRDRSLRVAVSHIAWEELRTQRLENTCAKVRSLRNSFDALEASRGSNFILSGMAPPALAVWSDLEMEAESKSAMAKFAEENCIEILPVGSDHGERAWRKYFNVAVEPPFNPRVVDREKRRKDIPDSWIFEAATDLLAQEGTILALCFDENLSSALSSIGVVVFREPADVLNHLEAISPVVAETTIGESTPAPTETPLAASLSLALGEFRDHEQKVLGFIAYFSTPAKEEVIELLASSGVEKNISRNVADRLVLANVIRDTGNHYVVTDRRLGELASVAVEEDIIELLSLGAGR